MLKSHGALLGSAAVLLSLLSSCGPAAIAGGIIAIGDNSGSSGGSPSGLVPRSVVTGRPRVVDSDSSATFEFTGSPAGVTFEARLDGASDWTVVASPLTYDQLDDGEHTFELRARTADRVELTPQEIEWTIDSVVPETSFAVQPDSFIANAARFVLRSSERAVGYEVRLDGGDFEHATSRDFTLSDLEDGPHRLEVRAFDRAGNRDQSPAVAEWTLDTVLPNAPDAVNAEASLARTVALNWTPAVDGSAGNGQSGSGIAGYRVFYGLTSGGPYDGDFAVEGVSPIDLQAIARPELALTGLPTCQELFVTVSAVDRAGNESPLSVEEPVRIGCGGDGTFASPVSYPLGGSPSGITLSDINGDGIPDILAGIATPSGGGLAIMLAEAASGRPTGTFAPGIAMDLGAPAAGVVSADFDADQVTDLAVIGGVDTLWILRGRGAAGVGDGTFGVVESFTLSGAGGSIVAGDFSGDRITDLAIAVPGQDVVQLFLGNGVGGRGDGRFTPGTDVPTRRRPVDLVATDINGDSILDLAVSCSDEPANGVYQHLGLGMDGIGSGRFGAANLVFAPPSEPAALVLGEFDSVSGFDFAVTDVGDNSINVRSAITSDTIPVGEDPLDIVAGDFNDDGIADLAVVNSGSGTVGVTLGDGVMGQGTGAFGAMQAYPAGVRPIAIQAIDLDGDDDLDFVVADAGNQALVVLLGNGGRSVGDGSFDPVTPLFDLPVADAVVAVGDLDGDGLPDIVAGTPAGIEVWQRTLRGFERTQSIPRDLVLRRDSLVIADLDADGRPDLTLIGASPATMFVLRGLEGAAFDPQPLSELPLDGLLGLQSAELNGDAIPDLIGLRDPTSGSAGGAAMTVLIGQGSGGRGTGRFTLGSSLMLATTPNRVIVNDLSSDGIMDLVVGRPDDGRLSAFVGNGANGRGDGTFAFRLDLTVCGAACALDFAIGEVTGDGITDLVGFADERLSRFGGNGSNGRGDGTFGPPVDLRQLGLEVAAMALADLNADRIQDCVVVGTDGSVSVYLGDGLNGRGAGRFTPLVGAALDLGTLRPSDVQLHDLDLDGALDLVVAGVDGVRVLGGVRELP